MGQDGDDVGSLRRGPVRLSYRAPLPGGPGLTPLGPSPPIDTALVRALVEGQFPQWAALPIRPVERSGWDNRSFRLGEDMLVRLPSARRYAGQVEKEQRWLPLLAPKLPLAVPEPLGLGEPAAGYPWPWSVYRWLDGTEADVAVGVELTPFAVALAGFLRALQNSDATGGPPPGRENFHRGGSLAVYDGEVWAALAALGGRVDGAAAAEVWRRAAASRPGLGRNRTCRPILSGSRSGCRSRALQRGGSQGGRA